MNAFFCGMSTAVLLWHCICDRGFNPYRWYGIGLNAVAALVNAVAWYGQSL